MYQTLYVLYYVILYLYEYIKERDKMNIRIKNKLKQEKGFGMGDIAVAIIVIFMFIGVIGGGIITIYNIQTTTKMSSIATLYGIQILEEIDRIDYEDVAILNNQVENEKFCTTCIDKFKIPSGINIELNVETPTPDNSNNTIKNINLKITANIANRVETIRLNNIKVKEL